MMRFCLEYFPNNCGNIHTVLHLFYCDTKVSSAAEIVLVTLGQISLFLFEFLITQQFIYLFTFLNITKQAQR